jgi:hypothetical protein
LTRGPIYTEYIRGGNTALIQENVGKESNHKIAASIREAAITVYRERYADFGSTFAVEKLAQVERIKGSRDSIRPWLIAKGFWERQRNSAEYRSRRDRRPCFDELIQFDGSHHKWFEDRGPKCCLITLIEEAMNTRISMFFEEETTGHEHARGEGAG